jgi:hypothetical protein
VALPSAMEGRRQWWRRLGLLGGVGIIEGTKGLVVARKEPLSINESVPSAVFHPDNLLSKFFVGVCSQ